MVSSPLPPRSGLGVLRELELEFKFAVELGVAGVGGMAGVGAELVLTLLTGVAASGDIGIDAPDPVEEIDALASDSRFLSKKKTNSVKIQSMRNL